MASNDSEVMLKTKVVFTINHFTTALKATDDQILSEEVTIGSDIWRVIVALEDKDGDLYLCVNLKVCDTSDDTVEAESVVYVRDSDGRTFSGHLKRQSFEKDSIGGRQEVVKRSQLLDQMDKHLPNNTLTIVFGILVFKPTDGLKGIGFDQMVRLAESSFIRKLPKESMLYKQLYNCIFVVKGQRFRESKAFLSDRSQVFHQMFVTNMFVKNKVTIDDIDATVFEEFLEFLHFGRSFKIDSMLEELRYVSDKYMVSDLKSICENLYYLSIEPNNAFNVLEVMDKYGNQELVAKSVEYIQTNWNQSLETEWRKLGGNDNKLIGKLMDGLKSGSNPKTHTMSYTYFLGTKPQSVSIVHYV